MLFLVPRRMDEALPPWHAERAEGEADVEEEPRKPGKRRSRRKKVSVAARRSAKVAQRQAARLGPLLRATAKVRARGSVGRVPTQAPRPSQSPAASTSMHLKPKPS